MSFQMVNRGRVTMRVRYVRCMAMACALLMGAPAYSAEIITGSELQRRCGVPKGSSGYDFCTGFAMGALTRYRELCRMEKEPTLDGAQARLIIEKYMRAYPELLNENAGVIAVRAFNQELGCPKGD